MGVVLNTTAASGDFHLKDGGASGTVKFKYKTSGVTSGGSGSLALGGILGGPCFGTYPGSGAVLQFGGQSSTNATYRIDGVWEFGNFVDGEIVPQQRWDGYKESDPPAGAVPGACTLTCS